jgi:bisphosphoglycerate-independent phosphoglycerate mutase (AlkP superfamily)
MNEKRPVVLLLVEGWGIGAATDGNAISIAEPKNFIELVQNFPVFALRASGLDVGLKVSEPGNYVAGYKAIGEPLCGALKSLDSKLAVIGSPVGVERLQQNFFLNSISKEKIVEVSGDQETNQIIKNVIDATVEAVLSEKSDLIVANIIQIDISASHGNLATTVDDIKTLDNNLKSLVDAVLTKHGTLIFVSDHGNAEAVIDLTTDITIGNTTNPVPCVVVNENLRGRSGGYDDSVTSEVSDLKISGSIKLVAPTVLKCLAVAVPPDIGESLI